MEDSTEIKKTREREIFDSVYRSRMSICVAPSERPDFLVHSGEGSSHFGVEIVEFFDSETEARLQRLPGYLGDILEHRKFRHKEDLRHLTVDTVSITDANGNSKHADVPAVVRQVSSLEACSKKVAEIIKAKDNKIVATCDHTHVNLIIADRTGLLGHLEPVSFYKLCCGPELCQVVRNCIFREIYFVTSFKSGPAYVPLNLIVTLAALFFFHTVIVRDHGQEVASAADLMRLFAAYLHATTTGPVGVRQEGSLVEVLSGDSGFIVNSQMALNVHSYNDWPWPIDVSLETAKDQEFPGGLLEVISVFEKKNTFSTEIAFPIVSKEGQKPLNLA